MDALSFSKKLLLTSIIAFLKAALKIYPSDIKTNLLTARNNLIRIYEMDYNNASHHIPHPSLNEVFARYLKMKVEEIPNLHNRIMYLICDYLLTEKDNGKNDRSMIIYNTLKNIRKVVCNNFEDTFWDSDNLLTIYNRRLAVDHNYIGDNCLSYWQYQDAVNAYSSAIKLDSRNLLYRCNRAKAYILLKQYKNAIADSKIAMDQDPDYMDAYNNLGTAYMRQNRLTEASAVFEVALAIEPDDPILQEKLKLINLRLSEEEEAGLCSYLDLKPLEIRVEELTAQATSS